MAKKKRNPKISILVPSRERINFKLDLIGSLIVSTKNLDDIELIFGIDADDPNMVATKRIVDAIDFVKMVKIPNRGKFIGINRIWNMLYPHAQGHILGYIGDDMLFLTPDWDEKIINEFTEEPQVKLVHCYDGNQKSNFEYCVNAFLHKEYTNIVGYFCREEFLVDWSDQWLYESFKAFDRVTYRPDIYIKHNHWTHGWREKDNTTNRMLSDNHTEKSRKLWKQLAPQRIEDVKKIAKYLNKNPNWSVVSK